MYAIISLFSYYTREFILPNPFEVIISDQILALIFSCIIGESIIHILAFNMCGMFYTKGSCRPLGSFIYFIFYIINIGVIIGIGTLIKNITWFCIIYMLTIIGIYVILNKLKETAYRL